MRPNEKVIMAVWQRSVTDLSKKRNARIEELNQATQE